MAMVVKANRKSTELGGHIATFASAATLYDIGFNHFWHAPSESNGGDLIYFHGHASPGMYARAFLEVQDEFDSFDNFIWQYADHQPRQNHWRRLKDIPALTNESIQMSKDLQQRGFRFVGPTICYAFMQAVGMVNDHVVGCFRHKQVAKLK